MISYLFIIRNMKAEDLLHQASKQANDIHLLQDGEKKTPLCTDADSVVPLIFIIVLATVIIIFI